MQGHKLLNAYFIDEERTLVECLWMEELTNIVREETIEAKDGDAVWENLLKHIDIDTLHEMTYKRIRDLDEAYKDQVIAIAKERGLIWEIDDIRSNANRLVIPSIFGDFDKENDKEKLFLYKLKLFEVEAIKNSKDAQMKKKLRQAKTIIEAIQVGCNIALSSGT